LVQGRSTTGGVRDDSAAPVLCARITVKGKFKRNHLRQTPV
jgi:hypothetical protein